MVPRWVAPAESASVFLESTIGDNGRSAPEARRRSSLKIINEAAAGSIVDPTSHLSHPAIAVFSVRARCSLRPPPCRDQVVGHLHRQRYRATDQWQGYRSTRCANSGAENSLQYAMVWSGSAGSGVASTPALLASIVSSSYYTT